jgi:amino acid transporter
MSDLPATESLKRDAFGWVTVVALVIATNGPLTTLMAWVPLGIAMGNGIGLPGSFALVGLLYIVFAAGFTAMSRYVKNAGAFYAYVAHALGPQLGTGTAFMAIAAYNACSLICYTAIGFFLSLAAKSHAGLELPWWSCTLAAIAVVHYFSFRNIEFSGKTLLFLMSAEVAVILCFDIAALTKTSAPDYLSWRPFSPTAVFTSGFGPSLVFVVSAYMGFETTAIYAEEVRDAPRAIPRASYAAIAVITSLYAASAWLLITTLGFDSVLTAASADPGNLWLTVTTRLLGPFMADVTSMLLITSLLAALISFNNASVRYWFALGRDGIISGKLAKIHPKQKSAYVAVWLQTAATTAAIVFFASLRADPMRVVAPCLGVPAAVGIVSVQALTSLAVLVFFARRRRGMPVWRCYVAPLASIAALVYFLYEMFIHVTLMVGIDALWVRTLPWITPAVGLAGVAFAYWLKYRRPYVYSRLGELLRTV